MSKKESKEKELVNFVVVGSRYQVANEKGELVPEYGMGRFRSGIQLELAMALYSNMVNRETISTGPWTSTSKATAATLAANAFSLTEVFLEELDKSFYRPPMPKTNNSDRK